MKTSGRAAPCICFHDLPVLLLLRRKGSPWQKADGGSPWPCSWDCSRASYSSRLAARARLQLR